MKMQMTTTFRALALGAAVAMFSAAHAVADETAQLYSQIVNSANTVNAKLAEAQKKRDNVLIDCLGSKAAELQEIQKKAAGFASSADKEAAATELRVLQTQAQGVMAQVASCAGGGGGGKESDQASGGLDANLAGGGLTGPSSNVELQIDPALAGGDPYFQQGGGGGGDTFRPPEDTLGNDVTTGAEPGNTGDTTINRPQNTSDNLG